MGEFQRLWGTTAIVAVSLALAGCGSSGSSKRSKFDPKVYGPASPRVVSSGSKVPVGGGRYTVGKPYTVAGKTYYPRLNKSYDKRGLASWYGSAFHGRKTANGEIYNMRSLTAAHPTMPLPSYARVTNLKNGRSVIVRVNDRGPFHGGRVIDVSQRTAELLDFKSDGIAKVRVRYVGRARIDGRDNRYLLASYRGPDAPDVGSTMVASTDIKPPARIGDDRKIRRSRTTEVASMDWDRRGGWDRPEAYRDDERRAFSRAAIRRAINRAGTGTSAAKTASEPPAATGAPMDLFSSTGFDAKPRARRSGPFVSSYRADKRIAGAFAAIDHMAGKTSEDP